MKKNILFKAVLAVLCLCFAGCYSTAVTEHKICIEETVDLEIDLVCSDNHDFAYVRAYRDGEDLVLYGKLDHNHGAGGPPEGHVDVTFLNALGEAVGSTRLPIVNRGNHRKGWRGAHFRVRMDPPVQQAKSIRLFLHDASLFPEPETAPEAVTETGL